MTAPRPVKAKGGGRKAIIHCNMWGPKGRTLWTFHDEEKIYLSNTADARSWAKKHGFDGIHITTGGHDRA